MDILKPDLDDPAAAMSQWEYKLAGKMEIAIRSSNAQYEEPEVGARTQAHVHRRGRRAIYSPGPCLPRH